jgi:5-methylthioadenosine/S-adenosylhomocysteine deaminase
MSILIRGATILAMDESHGSTPFTGDVLIEGDRIVTVGTVPPDARAERVIDGRDRLLMPGLINGHLHSSEALFKGRYDNMPLELWMLYSYPILGTSALPERLIYLRTMLVAIESLRNGVTTVVDDVFEAPRQDLDQLGAVFDAYGDIGMRATVSGHVIDRNFLETIPFTERFVPTALRERVAALPPPRAADYVAFAKQAFQRFHNRDGRLRFMVAPSAPQRCTADLMLAADELARQYRVPFHTHIVETKVQAVTGPALYGKTLVRYMHDLGLLHSGVTIAHSIWVTDEDIAMMGDAQVSIVHNAISNQKLGAGIAPVRKLLKSGVNVALGSDGICSNDTPRMFDVMHAAGLLHSISTPDYRRWLSAEEVLHAATAGGARSALLEDEVGSLAPGKKADLVMLDLRQAPFTPLNDIRNHLVYCENGSSIETVIVNGEIVLDRGRLMKIDEAAILDELRELMPAFQAQHAQVEAENRILEPHFAAIHRYCNEQDIGIHRLGTDDAWIE